MDITPLAIILPRICHQAAQYTNGVLIRMSDWLKDWWSGLGAARRHRLLGSALALTLLLLFSGLATELLEQELALFDAMIFAWVRSFQSPGMTVLMRAMTELGSPLVIAGLALLGGLTLYRRGQRIAPIAVLVSLLGGWLWDLMLKLQYQRPRPPGPWLVHASGYSFPSGHAVIAVAFYGVLAYYLTRPPLAGERHLAALIVSVLVVMLIGISRIYLGVHYPSDVLAGWAVGGVWASLCVMGAAAIRDRRERRLPSG